MTHFKALFLDIDGTILTPDDQVEASTKEAISQVQKKGLDVFLATGRPIHEIKELADDLNISSFIGYNGAYAIYKGDDLFQIPMQPKTVADFFKVANEHHHEIVAYTNTTNAFSTINHPDVEKFSKKFHLQKNELYSPSIVNGVLGMTLINLKENDHLLYEVDNGIHLSQVNIEGMQHCYDVIRDTVNKGIGIQKVLKHLGISKESAIAFGDGLNDTEMLQNVGESFAMGNAHPELFKLAKHKTTKVTNSGVYNGLKQLGLLD
ncbi:Cof-type HAD-IIB family hydrolase [Bacillota bacterium Lsc_1132]